MEILYAKRGLYGSGATFRVYKAIFSGILCFSLLKNYSTNHSNDDITCAAPKTDCHVLATDSCRTQNGHTSSKMI